MLSTAKKVGWSYLNESEGGRVLIKPKEGEPFGLSINDLVAACRSQEKVATFADQIGALLDQLAKWLSENESRVSRAYFGLEPDGAVLAIVQRGKVFDPDLEYDLSTLDLSVAENEAYDLLRFRVFALPFCSDETVSSFVKYSLAWQPRT